jgi:hypothetical protein
MTPDLSQKPMTIKKAPEVDMFSESNSVSLSSDYPVLASKRLVPKPKTSFEKKPRTSFDNN